jgi:hypothetical protein
MCLLAATSAQEASVGREGKEKTKEKKEKEKERENKQGRRTLE